MIKLSAIKVIDSMSVPLPPPEVLVGGMKDPIFRSHVWFTDNQPHPGVTRENPAPSHLISIRKATYHIRDPKVLEVVYQEMQQRPSTYFLLCHSHFFFLSVCSLGTVYFYGKFPPSFAQMFLLFLKCVENSLFHSSGHFLPCTMV